jgi:hypothetical protein
MWVFGDHPPTKVGFHTLLLKEMSHVCLREASIFATENYPGISPQRVPNPLHFSSICIRDSIFSVSTGSF